MNPKQQLLLIIGTSILLIIISSLVINDVRQKEESQCDPIDGTISIALNATAIGISALTLIGGIVAVARNGQNQDILPFIVAILLSLGTSTAGNLITNSVYSGIHLGVTGSILLMLIVQKFAKRSAKGTAKVVHKRS